MKIAVTYDNGNVFQHFGHTEWFKIYGVEDGEIVTSATLSASGSGHGALAGILQLCKVDVLICGGIGGGAKRALYDAGIAFFGGVTGDADAAVNAFLENKLNYNADYECTHHGEGHDCGSHNCGHDHSHGHNCDCHTKS